MTYRAPVKDMLFCMKELADLEASVPVAASRPELERALGQLPELTRSVVWLYYVEGYTHEEIASAFGRTPSFSKSQRSRGTARLRAQLAAPEVAAYA